MTPTEIDNFLAELEPMGVKITKITAAAWTRVLEPWDAKHAAAHLIDVCTRRTFPSPADFNRQLLEAPAKEADAEALAWSQAKTLIQRYGLGSALSLAAAGRLTGDAVTDAAVVAARQDIRYGSADAAWWRFRDAYREAAADVDSLLRPQLVAARPALPEVAS